MKTLIVYYSMAGNTAFAAEKIAGILGADKLEIKPEKAYPDRGLKKFFWGGRSAIMAETPVLQPYRFDSDLYNLIIIGFPVWASNMAPPLRTFIRDNDLSGKPVAAFACEAGSGAEKAFLKLKEALKKDTLEAELILIDPKNRLKPENDGKIAAFCEKLK